MPLLQHAHQPLLRDIVSNGVHWQASCQWHPDGLSASVRVPRPSLSPGYRGSAWYFLEASASIWRTASMFSTTFFAAAAIWSMSARVFIKHT